ncbi:MAG: hypothetical protein QOE33_3668 [Acidobacteriota bacterium]|nr:hypothetical protein [Acidobacteriota bacterium]
MNAGQSLGGKYTTCGLQFHGVGGSFDSDYANIHFCFIVNLRVGFWGMGQRIGGCWVVGEKAVDETGQELSHVMSIS